MGYKLAQSVSFCWVGDRAVFLDVLRDRYFCLDAVAELSFRRLCTSSRACHGDADRLVRLGLLEPTDRPQDLHPEMSAAATRDQGDRRPALKLSDCPGLARIGVRLVARRVDLWRLPLSDVLAAFRRRKRGDASAPAGDDSLALVLAGRFRALRQRLPLAAACLPDSLALADLLASQGISPTLVFGVRLNPFAAHCWLQLGETVLNDDLDRVAAFTPILVL